MLSVKVATFEVKLVPYVLLFCQKVVGILPPIFFSPIFSTMVYATGFKLNIKIFNIYTRVSVQGVESLWGDCRFIPADWGS